LEKIKKILIYILTKSKFINNIIDRSANQNLLSFHCSINKVHLSIITMDTTNIFCRRILTMVLEKVKAILAEQFDVEEDKITAETDLQEDLGADSLDVVDLLMSIEDEFEVEVPDEEIENIKTVGSLVDYIEKNQ
jgi:acyl carrier protein